MPLPGLTSGPYPNNRESSVHLWDNNDHFWDIVTLRRLWKEGVFLALISRDGSLTLLTVSTCLLVPQRLRVALGLFRWERRYLGGVNGPSSSTRLRDAGAPSPGAVRSTPPRNCRSICLPRRGRVFPTGPAGSRGGEPVANARFGEDQFRARGVSLELLPQMSGIDTQVVRLLDGVRPPDLCEKLALGHDTPGVAHQ